MQAELISTCQMFLVPSAIMFAALGVAGSEGLKTIICVMGAVTSDMWVWTVWTWKDVVKDTAFVKGTAFTLPSSNTTPVLLLSVLFALAWGICFWVHLAYGYTYGFERQKEAQGMFFAPKPKPARRMSFRLLRSRLQDDLRLLRHSWKK
jgi:hypothetical protein